MTKNITHGKNYFAFGGIELIENDEVSTRTAVRQLGNKLRLLSTAPHFKELQLTPVWPTADYKFTGRLANLVFQNLDPSSGAGIELYPEPTVTAQDVEFLLYGEGDPSDQTNYERFEFKWNNSATQFQISSQADGSGTLHPISIFTEGNADQILLNIDGTININTTDLVITGTVDIFHTATENDDHALEIVCDAAGFSDVKALDIDYITGALAPLESEGVILINIDETGASGGRVVGLDVLATEGSAKIEGLFAGVGVHPIEQLSGTFVNADSALNKAVDVLTAVSSGGAGNISIFVADNDTFTLGKSNKFEEIEFLLDTGSSGGGIAPTFEYSTGAGPTTWATFVPTDGTNGFKETGVVVWEDSDIPLWVVGDGSEFLIRITRTRNNLGTTPIVDQIGLASANEFSWDKDALITAAALSLTTGDLTVTAGDIDITVGELTVGGGFGSTGATISGAGAASFDGDMRIDADFACNASSGNSSLESNAYSLTAAHTGIVYVGHSRHATIGTLATTNDGDRLGEFRIRGVSTGPGWQNSIRLVGTQDGAAGTRVPGRLELFLIPDSTTAGVLRHTWEANGDYTIETGDLDVKLGEVLVGLVRGQTNANNTLNLDVSLAAATLTSYGNINLSANADSSGAAGINFLVDAASAALIDANGNFDLGTRTTAAPFLPSLTTTQRDALTPIVGMILFNSTTGTFQGYDGAWADLPN